MQSIKLFSFLLNNLPCYVYIQIDKFCLNIIYTTRIHYLPLFMVSVQTQEVSIRINRHPTRFLLSVVRART